jgi:diguanylate cyclase (GGDEF)-like protein
MATVLFLYTVNVGIPIRFRQARTISIASLVTYAVIVLFGVTRAPAGANADLVAFTTVVVLASLMITFRSEVAKRESFLLHVRERLSSEELQRVNRRLLMLSQTDALTSVFNRRFFDGAAHQARAEALRDGTWLSLMMIDVDYFKLLNDSLGHAEGDACLQLIARAIRDHVRAEDLVSRYGGEEFVVILPAATPFEATFVAERVRTAVEGLHYANPARRESVTVSIGVVAVAAEAKATIVELVKSADDALYAAKSAGRNRVFSASVPFVPAFGETKQVPRSLAEPVDV